MKVKYTFALALILYFFSSSVHSQTEHYKVYAVRFASVGHPMPISAWVEKGPAKDSISIDFMIWLIKGDNGKNILLDAGFLPGLEEAKEFDIVKYVSPDSTLSKLGLKAKDITDIIISHPHWDHIDGISLFPNAHVWIQKEDYNYFVGAAWQKDGIHDGFNPRDVHMITELNTAGRLTLVDGDDKEIIPGITVYTGSRHTFNSQFATVQTGLKKIVLASDNIWVYYSLDHLMPPSIGGTFDPVAYVKSMQRMKHLASDPRYIIPGHDSKIFSIFTKRADGVVQIE
ncbi:MAG TPA: N-acyl homoserine lactonase family protein [Puia sp.]|nr:N-acyl homoserine lactonase family protein [Puia sp.]